MHLVHKDKLSSNMQITNKKKKNMTN